jgi:hypothetical protein
MEVLERRRQEVVRAQRVLDQRSKMREQSDAAFSVMRAKRRAAEVVRCRAEAVAAKARNAAILARLQAETQQLQSNVTPDGLLLVPSTVAQQLKTEKQRYFQVLAGATEAWRNDAAARLARQQVQLAALSVQAETAAGKAREAETLFQEEKAVALAAHVSGRGESKTN